MTFADKKLARSIEHLLHLELLDWDPKGLFPEEGDYPALGVHVYPESKILGRYGPDDLLRILERAGITAKLDEYGFTSLRCEITEPEPRTWEYRICFDQTDNEHMLHEPIIHAGNFHTRAAFAPLLHGLELPMIFIRWVCLQNPRRHFTPERPALPGQRFPGLRIGDRVFEMYHKLAELNGFAGLVNSPEYLHNAALYSKRFRYLDPVVQGKLDALYRDFLEISLAEATWGELSGCVEEVGVGRVFDWHHQEQILPVSPLLCAHFESRAYLDAAAESFNRTRFEFDRERWLEKCPLNEDGAPKVPVDRTRGL